MGKNIQLKPNKYIYTLIVFLVTTTAFGQSSLDYKWYLNGNAGLAQGFCDIQDENNHIGKLQNETDRGYGLRLGRYVGSVMAFHGQFSKINLEGVKTTGNLKYYSELLESQVGFSVNILNLFGEKRGRKINMYAVSGVGMIFYRSKAYTDGLKVAYGYNDDGSKGTREQAIVVPIGGGLDFKLSNKFYINLESVLRLSNTDLLDGKESGAQNDAYFYSSAGITYHFGANKEKPVPEPEEIVPEEIAQIPDGFVNLEFSLPKKIVSGKEFKMTCMINKGNFDGKAEFTQVLPIGFKVLDENISGARTEFDNYTLHIYWDELPADTVFEISYTILPEKIYGKFGYTSILYLDKTAKEYKFRSSMVVEKPNVEEEIALPETETLAEAPTQTETDIVVPDARKVEITREKTEFRVQVRAAKKAIIPITKLANRYNLTEHITEDFVGGWYRYSVGSFATYEEAKEFRNLLIANNGVRDAFIVAFFEGKRLNELSELKEVDPSAYPYPNTTINELGKVYRVQILALSKKRVAIATLKEIYGLDQEVNEEIIDNWRKYTVGSFASIERAHQFKNTMINKGITDAFVVVYQDGKRVNTNN